MISFITSLFEFSKRKRSSPGDKGQQCRPGEKGSATSEHMVVTPDTLPNTPRLNFSPDTDFSQLPSSEKDKKKDLDSSSLGLYQTPSFDADKKKSPKVVSRNITPEPDDQDTSSSSFVTALPMYETPVLRCVDINTYRHVTLKTSTDNTGTYKGNPSVSKQSVQLTEVNCRSRVRTLRTRDKGNWTPQGLRPRRSINEIRAKLGIKRLDMDSAANVHPSAMTITELPTAKKTNVSVNSRSRECLTGEHSVVLEFSNENDSNLNSKCRKNSSSESSRRATSPTLSMGEAKTAVGLLLAQKKRNIQAGYQLTEEEITYTSIEKSQTVTTSTLEEQTSSISQLQASLQNQPSLQIGILPPAKVEKKPPAFNAVNPYAALNENLGVERDQMFCNDKSAFYSSTNDETQGELEHDQSTMSQDWYNEWYQYEIYKDEQERQALGPGSASDKRNEMLNESKLSNDSRQALFERRDSPENRGEPGYDFSPLHDDECNESNDDPFVAKDNNCSWISDISQNTSNDQQRFFGQSAINGISGLESSALSAPSPLQQQKREAKSMYQVNHPHPHPPLSVGMTPLESSALSGPSPLQVKREPRRAQHKRLHRQYPPDMLLHSSYLDKVPCELTIQSRKEHKRLQKEQLIVQALRRLRDNLSLVNDVEIMNMGDEDGPLMKTRMNKEGILTGYSDKSRFNIVGTLHHHLLSKENQKIDCEQDTQESNALYFIASLVNLSTIDGTQFDLGRWKPKEWVRNALRSELGRPYNNTDLEISTMSGQSAQDDSLGNSTISTKESSPRREEEEEDSTLSHTIAIVTTLLQKLSLTVEEYVASSSRLSYDELIRLYNQLLTIPRHNMDRLISAFTFSTRPSSRNSNLGIGSNTIAMPIRRKPLELSKFINKRKDNGHTHPQSQNQESTHMRFISERCTSDEILSARIEEDSSDDITVSTMESGPTFLKDEADKLSANGRDSTKSHHQGKVERISEEDTHVLGSSKVHKNDRENMTATSSTCDDENKENYEM